MDRYALVIGIGSYEAMVALSKPAGDAIAVEQVLKRAGWRVTCLSDRVTYDELERALKTFLERQAAGQDALIYFTGHGFMVEESHYEQRGYLATSNCVVDYLGETIVSQRRALSFSYLNGLIRDARLSSLVVLLDCCHGGLFVEDGLVKRSFQANPDQNFCWIAACRSFQQAYARGSEQHSFFTGALLAALAESGEVTVLSVLRSVNASFKQLALQEPIYIAAGKDIPLISPAVSIASAVVSQENPYQGLQAFTKETKRFFFGRDRVVDDLVLKLQASNFVPLIGPSGSGKSSVVRAGLIPRLEDLGWHVLEPMKPGVEPIYELKRSLDPIFDRRQLTSIHQRLDSEGLRGILELLPDRKHLLVVDQFEEVFTFSRDDRAKQRRFIEMLMGLEVGDRLSVVTTMRSDFVDSWQSHGDLVGVLQGRTVWMPPLEGNDLRDAIVKPAEVQGYRFETELEALILEDVAKEMNCLPLLEFALEKLWEQRECQNRQLTVEVYREMGRLMGALDRYATDWYSRLTTKQQNTVRRVMLELVRIGIDTKDTRWRRQASDILELENGIEDVIEQMVERRLIIRENDAIDLTHERLMDGWQFFEEWRQDNRDLRRLAQKVKDAHKEWQNKGGSNEYLIQGGFLSDVREHLSELQLGQISHEFYCLSEKRHKENSAFLIATVAESELRDKSIKAFNLISAQPVQAAIEMICAVGVNIEKIQHKILAPVKLNLREFSIHAREKNCFQGLSGTVRMAYSPDGYTVASGNEEGFISVQSLVNRSDHCMFEAHLNAVTSIAFSLDGKTIASGGIDSIIRLWDLKGNLMTPLFQGHQSHVIFLAFLPDNRSIISGSYDNTVRVWDLKGNCKTTILASCGSMLSVISLSPDGKIIASSGEDCIVRLWDVSGKSIGKPFDIHKYLITSMSFSPNGKTIATADEKGNIYFWDLSTGEVLNTLCVSHGRRTDIKFSPDGCTLASCGDDSDIYLWNLNIDPIEEIFRFDQRDMIVDQYFSVNSEILVTCGYKDGLIRCWDLKTLPAKQFLSESGSIWPACFSPDGNFLASHEEGWSIDIWSVEASCLLQSIPGNGKRMLCVTFSPNSQIIAAKTDWGEVCLWDVQDARLMYTFEQQDEVLAIAFSNDSKTLAYATDKKIFLWSIDGDLICQFDHPDMEYTRTIAFSPSGAIIASGGSSKTIRLFSVKGKSVTQTFQGHDDTITSVAFSPNEKYIISGSFDRTIRLWDLNGNPIGQALQGHQDGVRSVQFLPDNLTIISSGFDNTIRLWDLAGNPISQPLRAKNERIRSVWASPDGQKIASVDDNGIIRFYMGGTWEDWLRICCDRLRHHPILNDPNNLASVEACEVCRKYVWEAEGESD
jgi:WD40 repeat protein/energy-coupling factor transporter ATP-binding protein EcfA2